MGVVLLFKILVEQWPKEKNVKTHGGDAPKRSEAQVKGFGMNKTGTAAGRRQTEEA